MHTIDLLEQALDAARRLGYTVRLEWLDGQRAGACELRGKRYLFLDLAQGPMEQLDLVLEALRRDARLPDLLLHHDLRDRIALRKSA